MIIPAPVMSQCTKWRAANRMAFIVAVMMIIRRVKSFAAWASPNAKSILRRAGKIIS